MKSVRAVLMVLLCAIAVVWVGNLLVAQQAQFGSMRNERAMPFAHDEDHHRHHREGGADRGMGELVGSSVVFAGVVAVVVVPSVLRTRKKRTA